MNRIQGTDGKKNSLTYTDTRNVDDADAKYVNIRHFLIIPGDIPSRVMV